MIITIPYAYNAQLLHARARKPKDHILWSEVDVKIDEATLAEAPVALRVMVGDEWDEIRWRDGAFWSPSMRHCGRHVSASEFESEARKWYCNPLVVNPCRHAGIRERIEEIDGVREVTWSNRQHYRDAIQKKALDFLVVGGVVHERQPEPVYVVLTEFGKAKLRITDASHYVPREHSHIFRADRFAEAAAVAEAIDASFDPSRHHAMEILMPETLRFDDEAANILGAARLASDPWNFYDKTLAETRAALVSAIAAHEPIEPAIVAGLQRIARHTGCPDWLRLKVNAALDRWSMRPVSFEDDSGDIAFHP